MTPSTRAVIMGGRWRFPSTFWFPVAAAWAMVVLPWSVLGQLGWVPAPAGLDTAVGHAHEMLVGYALAVVAGYTLTPAKRLHALTLLPVWVLARWTWLLWPEALATLVLNVGFAAGLAVSVVPIYWRATKWRNRSVAAIMVLLTALVVAFHVAQQMQDDVQQHQFLLLLVLALSALMFFMGGRILAPAIAGHMRRDRGEILEHRVQPWLEGTVLLTLMLVVVALVSGWPRVAGLLLLLCAVAALLRVWRWRAWCCWNKPDLLALLAGYACVIWGWVMVAMALWGRVAATPALHLITIGALGSLTFAVMLRTQLFRTGKGTDAMPWMRLAVVAIVAAALVRISNTSSVTWVVLAIVWAICFGALLIVLLGLLVKPRHARQPV